MCCFIHFSWNDLSWNDFVKNCTKSDQVYILNVTYKQYPVGHSHGFVFSKKSSNHKKHPERQAWRNWNLR